ncbi:MAG: PTS sugar transporter subunit IIA [Coprobacillaceae bacterium]
MDRKAIQIEELLKQENVRILDTVSDWKDAIKVAITPLIEQGYCEQRYIDGIIENTYKFGPYYVLCEDLALIHAEADKGVISTQLAITVLKNPVKFKADGFDVRVLIAFGATDSEAHLYAMQAISNIFADAKRVSKIVNATSTEEIYKEFILSVDV